MSQPSVPDEEAIRPSATRYGSGRNQRSSVCAPGLADMMAPVGSSVCLPHSLTGRPEAPSYSRASVRASCNCTRLLADGAGFGASCPTPPLCPICKVSRRLLTLRPGASFGKEVPSCPVMKLVEGTHGAFASISFSRSPSILVAQNPLSPLSIDRFGRSQDPGAPSRLATAWAAVSHATHLRNLPILPLTRTTPIHCRCRYQLRGHRWGCRRLVPLLSPADGAVRPRPRPCFSRMAFRWDPV